VGTGRLIGDHLLSFSHLSRSGSNRPRFAQTRAIACAHRTIFARFSPLKKSSAEAEKIVANVH